MNCQRSPNATTMTVACGLGIYNMTDSAMIRVNTFVLELMIRVEI